MSKEARFLHAALVVAAVFSTGASYRTENFIVSAPTPQLAKEIGDKAESDRQRLSMEWLGRELAPWSDKCPITAHVAPHLGAGGATSFVFSLGRPSAWTMTIQGSRERLLDSVLPHEVTHTVFATHFGRPLPRWADEGACTTVEHVTERKKQQRLLIEFLTTNRGIAFNRMFAMKEYPADVLPLYAQGFSLARYLIYQGGKRKFVNYVGDGMRSRDWSASTNKHYGIRNLSDLQVTWLNWVKQGSPQINAPTRESEVLLVSNQQPTNPQPTNPQPSKPAGTVAVVPIKKPQSTQLAATVTRKSWYIQQRDIAMTANAKPSSQAKPPAALFAKQGHYSPGSIRGIATTPTTLTRPQPIGRPKQTVIEWTHVKNPMPSTRIDTTPTRYIMPSLPLYNSSILPRSSVST